MTRKEEIRQEAHRKYPYEGGTKGTICEWSIPIFIQGAEWADKTMIKKACEWLNNNAVKYESGRKMGYIPLSFIEDMIEEFRKAMEE